MEDAFVYLKETMYKSITKNNFIIENNEDPLKNKKETIGKVVINLNKWREEKIQDKLEHWMLLHKNCKEGLFIYGTQPLLNLVFYNNFEMIDIKWNFYKLGHGNETITNDVIKKMKILHWEGSKKTWLKNGYYKQHWTKYKVI